MDLIYHHASNADKTILIFHGFLIKTFEMLNPESIK